MIGTEVFEKWKKKRDIPSGVRYLNDSTYYGKRWRCRPGVFFVAEEVAVHWSYDSSVTILAAFEDEIRVTIQLRQVEVVRLERLSLFWRLLFGFPKFLVALLLRDGSRHEIILYEDPSRLTRVLTECGVQVKS